MRDNGSFDLNAPVAQSQTVSDISLTSGQPITNGNGAATNSYLSPGTYQAALTDSNGLPILTQAVDLPYVIVDDTNPGTPPPSGSTICKNGNEQSDGNRTPNGTTVGGFGNSTEFMVYTFANVPTAGNYTFSIHYASGDNQAGIDLVVNSTPYQMRPAGTASWTPNATATTTIYLNQGTNTIRIQGSGAGNFTYDQLCINTGGGSPPPTGCNFSVNPSVSNANPACDNGITLFANCSGSDCGSVSFSWSGSNGSSYGGANPSFNAPGANGSVTYTLTAGKAGCSNLTGSTSINVSCGGGSPPSGLQITGASLNCGSGTVTLNMSGLNNNPVEYKAIGLQDWSTAQLVIPSWQRNGTNFTFYARQASNNEATISYTTGCAGYRLAAVEPTANADDELWVSPNPTTGKVVVRFRLGEQQTGTISVVSESGKTLQARPVVGSGRMQDESLDLSGQPVGLYVVQLKSGSVLKTAKVLVR